MKITAIKTLVVNAEMRNWVFVKVETDQPGLWGWGEASLEWKTRAVVGAVEDFAPMVVGEDPTRIEHLYQKLYRQSFWRLSVIGMSAISGIEQACWDILGKSLSLPVYKLLGGAVRERVRMYTHLGGGNMKSVYETFDPAPLIDLALAVVAKGYTAVKVVCVPYSEPLMNVSYAKRFAQAIEKLRLAVGDAVDIMIDFHGRTYPAMAIAYINAVSEFNPFFCEEPIPPENVAALREVRRAVRVPIATGERLVTRHSFAKSSSSKPVILFSRISATAGACSRGRRLRPWRKLTLWAWPRITRWARWPMPPPCISPFPPLIFSFRKICSRMSPGDGMWSAILSRLARATG